MTDDGGARIGPEALVSIDRRVSAGAMGVISIWSYIDVEIAAVTTSLLKADFVVVCEMLASLRSARDSAIRAAAKAALPPKQRALFNKTIDELAKVRRITRDKYAHHLWLYWPAEKRAILMDPKDAISVYARISERLAQHEDDFAKAVESGEIKRAGQPGATDSLFAFFEQKGSPLPEFPREADMVPVTLERVREELATSLVAYRVAERLRYAFSGSADDQVRTGLSSLLEYLRDQRTQLEQS